MKNYLFCLFSSLLLINSFIYSQPILAKTRENKAYVEQVKNAVYHLPDGQIIALLNGRSQYQDLSFILQAKKAFGDINGDSLQDVIVILTKLKQGTQIANYLAVFLGNRERKLNNVDTLDLEDNMKLEAINLHSRQLIINFLAYSSHDLFCCPTQKKQLKYRFDTASKTLIPLSVEAQNKPQDSLRINRRSRDVDENNELQIKF